jgi:pyruvate formate lyase activating enzyme
MTLDEVLAEVARDRIFYDESGGGVTISGGEPMLQPHFVMALLERCRREAIHTAVETCGLGNRAILERVASLADLILFDLKLFDEARHRAATGHGNSGILANMRLLSRLPADVRVRIPLVPGVNDDDANIAAIGAFVRDAGLTQVDVLPYHRAGMAKYDRLGRTYALPEAQPPTAGAVAAAVGRLKQFGLEVACGGAA